MSPPPEGERRVVAVRARGSWRACRSQLHFVTVHLPSNAATRRRPGRRLQPGTPATPGTGRLGLLPSGPDPIHEVPPRRTRPSTLRARCRPEWRTPSGRDSAPHVEVFGYRAPLAPRLARSEQMLAVRGWLSAVGGGSAVIASAAPQSMGKPPRRAGEAGAEGEGFEPSRAGKRPTAFRVPRTRPDYAIPPVPGLYRGFAAVRKRAA